MKNEKITLKEVCAKYNCSYENTLRKLKRLLAADRELSKHISSEGRKYLLDDYAVEQLKPKCKTKEKAFAIDDEDIRRLKEEKNSLMKKQRNISKEIKQRENNLLELRMKMISAAVYKCLGRGYLNGDENRLAEYLSDSDDFKTFMNTMGEDMREE